MPNGPLLSYTLDGLVPVFHHDLLYGDRGCMLLRQGASLVLHYNRSDWQKSSRLANAEIPVCPTILAVDRFSVLTLGAARPLHRAPCCVLIRPRAFRVCLVIADDAPSLLHVSSLQLARRVLQRLHLAQLGRSVLEGQAARAAILRANLGDDVGQLRLVGASYERPLLRLLLADVPVSPSEPSGSRVRHLAVALLPAGSLGSAPGASLAA
mmetsp:Transcript_23442/g.76195  ORF Transcript_23442/g.76195 Transcript_23442/m.76195 type:complete len:210 (-) Transcript_23442:2785-3414(-)